MKHFTKSEFIEAFFDQLPNNVTNDLAEKIIIGFLLNNVRGGKLYKYRSVNNHSLTNLKDGTLFCSIPSSFNDPFDCQLGVDIQSYISEIFGPELAPFESYLVKFGHVCDGKIQLASCTEHEKAVFINWQNNQNIMSFLNECRSTSVGYNDLGLIILENTSIILELLLPFIFDEQHRLQMSSAQKMFPDLLAPIPQEEKMLIAQENSTYEDFARILGIKEDADEITLTSLIYRKHRPDEAFAVTKADADIAGLVSKIKDIIDRTYRVGCLCTDYKNRLMWSHYADGHKGFCVEYDFSVPCTERSELLILPVVYSRERPKCPWRLALTPSKDTDEAKKGSAKAMIQSLVTKDDAWQYEDEWRIIALQSAGIESVKMPPISCIYVGALCPEEHKTVLYEIARAHGIPIMQMTIDRGEYTLHSFPLSVP